MFGVTPKEQATCPLLVLKPPVTHRAETCTVPVGSAQWLSSRRRFCSWGAAATLTTRQTTPPPPRHPGAEIKFSSVEDKYYNVTFKTPDGSPIGDGILKAAEDAGCAVENSTMDAGVKGYFAKLSCDEGTGQAAGGAEGYEGEVTVNFTLK